MYRQLRQCQVPVLHGVCPTLRGFQYTRIEQFEQAVLVGEAAFGFGQFAKLPMHRFDRIGGVDSGAHVVRVFEVR